MAESKLLIGLDGTIVSYPRTSDGGPFFRRQLDSVEVKIGTPALSLSGAAYVTADVDDLSTALADDAEEGATQLEVEDAHEWIRARRYLAGVDDDGGEWVEVEAANQPEAASTTLRLAEPLNRALSAGAPVVGFAVSASVSAAQAQFIGEGVALWRGELGDTTVEWSQAFQFVRRMVSSTLTPSKLTKKWPAVRTLHDRQDLDLEELIGEAWEDRVVPLLQAHGISPEDVISVDALEPMHGVGCLMQMATLNPKISVDVFDRIKERWAQVIETTFARKDWYTAAQDEDPTVRPETPPPVRTGVRLVR